MRDLTILYPLKLIAIVFSLIVILGPGRTVTRTHGARKTPEETSLDDTREVGALEWVPLSMSRAEEEVEYESTDVENV